MQQGSHSAGQQNEQYSALAGLYDHIMDHVDYEAWANYLLALCHVHDHVPNYILELACGTGNLTLELVNSGLSVVGTDRSTAMLKQAAMKYSKRDLPGNRCFFIWSDMTSPPVRSAFDTILCIYDSINYLSTLEHIRDALESILSRLEGGGVFIFDMCTEYNSMRHFTNSSSSEQFGNYSYERKSRYKKADRTQITEFTITSLTDGSVMRERHVQYIHPLNDLRDMLFTNFPGQVRMFKDYTLDPPDERCERFHIFITKS